MTDATRRVDALLPRVGGAIVFCGVVAALLLGALAPASTLSALEGGVECFFLATTGLRCPLCGMTHATVAAGGGDLGAAFASHPVFPVVLAFGLWGGWRLALARPLSVAGRKMTIAHVLCGTAVVWAANLVAQWAA